MATDDERRRVAERMRASAGMYDFCASNIALDMGIVGSGCSEGYNARHRLAWLRLADLIEPSDHIGDSDKMVDREALLALADEIEGPECVMRWCNGAYAGIMFVAINHERIARRIREALGVVG